MIDYCRRCHTELGENDITLCRKCREIWSSWKEEKGFRYKAERIRAIRKAWYGGQELP